MNAPTATIAQLRTPQQEQLSAVSVGLTNSQGFELAQRAAKCLAASSLVPKEYQGNLPNCVIALNMAARVGADPLMVMQNLVIVHNRPTWSAQFLIATVNTCGRFSALRYEFFGKPNTDEWGCRAWAIEKATGEKLVGTDVTIAIAKKEGWFGKSGSKWQSIPQQMLIYRAGSWWTRAYAPELSMGLHTADEMIDIYDTELSQDGTFQVTADSLRSATSAQDQTTVIDSETAGSPGGDEEPGGAGEAGQGGSGEMGAEGTASAGPTFEDAIAAVQRGEIDFARDVAAGLPDNQRQQIEAAITNRQKQPEQKPAGKRGGQQSFSVE